MNRISADKSHSVIVALVTKVPHFGHITYLDDCNKMNKVCAHCNRVPRNRTAMALNSNFLICCLKTRRWVIMTALQGVIVNNSRKMPAVKFRIGIKTQ